MRCVVALVFALGACGRFGFDAIGAGGDGGSDADGTTVDAEFVGSRVTYVKASNTNAGDAFGAAVSLAADGDTLAVGAYDEASGATMIDGNQLDNSEPSAGAVYIYVRAGITWQQQAYIKASNAEAGDLFGTSVSLSTDGNTLAVGAAGEDSNATGVNGNQTSNLAMQSGAVYVFTRSGTTWTQQAYIKAEQPGAGDSFGQVVALAKTGSQLAISANREASGATGTGGLGQGDNSAPNAGAVYVFTRQGTWLQRAYLKASNTESSDYFGESLAMSSDGSTIAVGAYYEASGSPGIGANQLDNFSPNAGAVYVFGGDAATWTQQAYIKAPNAAMSDQFGINVGLSAGGGRLVVSTHLDDSNARGIGGDPFNDAAQECGSAHVYKRITGLWEYDAYIKASNAESMDYFGLRVAVSGDGSTFAVGSIAEAGGGMGVGGNENDNSVPGSGAVYVFSGGTGNWVQRAYVKATNPRMDTTFTTPSLSGNGAVLAVGSYRENSASTGIDNDATNSGALLSGAVYIYE